MKTFNSLIGIFIACLLTAGVHLYAAGTDDWIVLFDGTDLENWTTTGEVNWNIDGNVVQADTGSGMLVTRQRYGDFQLKLEFWADEKTNSGVFIRCSGTEDITPASCYEVNIFDTRPDQSFRTGAIVDVSPPASVINTEGRWNTYEIIAHGTHMKIILNGTTTVDAHDDRLGEGHIALQYAAGGIKFRNVRIRDL